MRVVTRSKFIKKKGEININKKSSSYISPKKNIIYHIDVNQIISRSYSTSSLTERHRIIIFSYWWFISCHLILFPYLHLWYFFFENRIFAKIECLCTQCVYPTYLIVLIHLLIDNWISKYDQFHSYHKWFSWLNKFNKFIHEVIFLITKIPTLINRLKSFSWILLWLCGYTPLNKYLIFGFDDE